jgi:hypothetical protein
MGANFFISLGFTATPPPYAATHLTPEPGFRARQQATSRGSEPFVALFWRIAAGPLREYAVLLALPKVGGKGMP